MFSDFFGPVLFLLQWRTITDAASTLNCFRTTSRAGVMSQSSWQITCTGAPFTNKPWRVFLVSGDSHPFLLSLSSLSIRFIELFDSAQYEEAALLAARSPRGVLRNLDTMDMFKGVHHREISEGCVKPADFIKLNSNSVNCWTFKQTFLV